MKTVTISMRVPVAEAGKLNRLAQDMNMDRPAFLKQALKRGAADLVFESACRAYRNGEATLSRAAEMAGVTSREMMLRMQESGLEMNYGVADLHKDRAS